MSISCYSNALSSCKVPIFLSSFFFVTIAYQHFLKWCFLFEIEKAEGKTKLKRTPFKLNERMRAKKNCTMNAKRKKDDVDIRKNEKWRMKKENISTASATIDHHSYILGLVLELTFPIFFYFIFLSHSIHLNLS